MTITGRQIREARNLLGWRLEVLAIRSGMSLSTIERAEAPRGEARITVDQEAAIRGAFEVAGIGFGVGDNGGPVVRRHEGRTNTIPTGRQVREGRALVGLSQAELAAAADVALGLVIRVEAMDGMPMITGRDAKAISGALGAAGVEFTQADGRSGVGLRRDCS